MQCILCGRCTSKDMLRIVYCLDDKLLGVDRSYKTRGVHEGCLSHFTAHLPKQTGAMLVEFKIPRSPSDPEAQPTPCFFLSDPQRFYLPRYTFKGRVAFSLSMLRKLFGAYPEKRKLIPRAVLDKLSRQCEGCGSHTGLEIHHKIPVWFGGENNPENLVVLCHECHKHFPSEAPSLDLLKMLMKCLLPEVGRLAVYRAKVKGSP